MQYCQISIADLWFQIERRWGYEEKHSLCLWHDFGKICRSWVSCEVCTQYNRTKWAIENNNSSFYNHEIQFSALIGGKDGAFENFREFITEYDDVEKKAAHKMLVEKLYDCLIFLPESDRELIEMLYFENKTERECAEILCTSQQNVHKKKRKILCKLNKLLEKE